MKLILSIICVLTLIFSISHCSAPTSHIAVESQISQHILNKNIAFKSQTDNLIELIASDKNQPVYQSNFDSLRKSFKDMEWAVAYFMPETNRFMNGPNLDEIEFEESAIIEAEGLQTIEEYIYPTYNIENKAEILRYLKKLKTKSDNIDVYFSNNTISIPQAIEALRNEVFRITTLGITGFDTPISRNGLKEVAYSLNGIAEIFDIINLSAKSKENIKQIKNTIQHIKAKLSKPTNPDTFDYLTFITNDLNKLSTEIMTFIKSENIKRINVSSPIDGEADHMFSKNAFNKEFYVPHQKYNTNELKEKLGRKLFTDKILSENGNRSCQSCHNPKLAFTDGLKTSVSLTGKPLQRNSPSLTYSNFQHGQFWDMRREDLESQSADVIINKDEMHGTLENIVKRLEVNKYYKQAFKKAFKADTIQSWQIQNALASYIRSLSTFSSDFDKYMQGDKKAMTKEQIEGFNLFVGKGKCATCHFIPLFNGTVPPDYTKTESEVLGTASTSSNIKISNDLGRGALYQTIPHAQHAFKTLSLRNVNLTAPYMHNGAYATLEQVMDFYNNGGGHGFGFEIENQTLPADKLNLSKTEISKIITFLHSLTDKQYVNL